MPAPTVTRNGEDWAITWPDEYLRVDVRRVRDTRGGPLGELAVYSLDPANAQQPQLAGPLDMYIQDPKSQASIATGPARRVNHHQWDAVISRACSIVAEQFRQPSATVRLVDAPGADAPVPEILPGVPLGQTTLLYGDGESLKSMTAGLLAVCLAAGIACPLGGKPPRAMSVLVLDAETDNTTWARNARRIALGLGLSDVPASVYYRGDTGNGDVLGTLEQELPAIRADISRLGIEVVIVDSLTFAVRGSLIDDEVARGAVRALRQMSPATRIAICHVTHETAKQTAGSARPFGSVHLLNGARSAFELRRVVDAPDPDRAELGLYHRKGNPARHQPDRAFSVRFVGTTGPIAFEAAKLAEIPDLSGRRSLSDQIRDQLRTGARDTAQLAGVTGYSEDTVRKTLNRMQDVVCIAEGGGRNRPSTWGLKA